MKWCKSEGRRAKVTVMSRNRNSGDGGRRCDKESQGFSGTERIGEKELFERK